MSKIILGIDPGSRIAGYGAIEIVNGRPRHVGHGVLKLPLNGDFSQRLLSLSDQLNDLVMRWQPQAMVVEKIFLGKNPDSAFKLGQVRGVCLERSARHGIEVIEYAARSVKKSVTGSGGASKEHVRKVVLNVLGVVSDCEMDATDALALALCHFNKASIDMIVSQPIRGKRF